SDCKDETVTVTPASPSIKTTQSAGGVVGVILNDTATLSGGYNPTGTITFNLYAPSDATCSNTPFFTDPKVALSGLSASTAGTASTAVGTWRWTATYNGDAHRSPVSSGCKDETITVTLASPSIKTTPSAGGVVGVAILNDTAA